MERVIPYHSWTRRCLWPIESLLPSEDSSLHWFPGLSCVLVSPQLFLLCLLGRLHILHLPFLSVFLNTLLRPLFFLLSILSLCNLTPNVASVIPSMQVTPKSLSSPDLYNGRYVGVSTDLCPRVCYLNFQQAPYTSYDSVVLSSSFNLLFYLGYWGSVPLIIQVMVQELYWTLFSSPTSCKFFSVTWGILHVLAVGYSRNSSSSQSHPHLTHGPWWNPCHCLNLLLLCALAPTAASAGNDLSLLLHSSAPLLGLQSSSSIPRKPAFASPWTRVPSVDSHGFLYYYLVLHLLRGSIISCIFACLPL